MIDTRITTKQAHSLTDQFPKLMVNRNMGPNGGKGLILLMSSEREGTVVYSGGTSWPIGHHSDTWVTSDLKDFEETIALENHLRRTK